MHLLGSVRGDAEEAPADSTIAVHSDVGHQLNVLSSSGDHEESGYSEGDDQLGSTSRSSAEAKNSCTKSTLAKPFTLEMNIHSPSMMAANGVLAAIIVVFVVKSLLPGICRYSKSHLL